MHDNPTLMHNQLDSRTIQQRRRLPRIRLIRLDRQLEPSNLLPRLPQLPTELLVFDAQGTELVVGGGDDGGLGWWEVGRG